ncbi:MAG: hypothetical protein P1V20_29715 [Verrucomicrobiales bacterium]|nr:hypothetical protein [Verrucomicrobiales bacterium]
MEDPNETDDGAWGDPMLCRALWLAVIVQALVDARSQSKKLCNRKERAAAKAWLAQSGPESDFEITCDLAGVRPEDVRAVFKRTRRGEKTVDFRCLRKPKLTDRLIIREKLELNEVMYKQQTGGNQ